MSRVRTAACALAVAALAGCRPDCTPATGGEAPIVLLVTVDTFRADHMGSGAPAHTPALDRLAAEGVRFTDAWSAANVTVPSHLSILTSQPLATHRVLSNHATRAGPLETLPAAFGAAGYRPAAFVSALHLSPKMLLGQVLQGLDRFEGPSRASKPWRAEETTDHALAWLRGACRGPAFAWIHLWDPHMPYEPPAPFDRAYYDGDPRDARHTSMAEAELDWILYDLSGIRPALLAHPASVRAVKRGLGVNARRARQAILYPDALDSRALDPAVRSALLGSIRGVQKDLRRRLPYNPPLAGFLTGIRDVAYPRALYAGEISYVDREIGRLRDTLADWGLAERTVLLVTGDHGEGLGDHGLYFNHLGLWNEMLHVPLIVWAPGRLAPAVRADPVNGLDVAPTLLGLVGVAPPPAMEGRDLFHGPPARALVAEAVRGAQVTLRDGSWKLVRTLQPQWINDAFHRQRGEVELYDVTADPAERTNRLASDPVIAAALSARLDDWMTAHGVGTDGAGYVEPAHPVSKTMADRLRSLGYAE